MKKRKLYALGLFFLLSIPLGSLVCLQLIRLVIQHEMKEKLEKQKLQTVVIKKSDVIWVKKNSEIVLNGRLFDIKSISEEKEKLVLHGLYDDEETAIENFLYQNTQKGDTKQHQSLTGFFQLLLGVYKTDSAINQFRFFIKNKTFLIENNLAILQPFIKVTVPPPKV